MEDWSRYYKQATPNGVGNECCRGMVPDSPEEKSGVVPDSPDEKRMPAMQAGWNDEQMPS
ncbi:MAG TPA: hypothetical protein VHP38_09860 [Ruminiclostridium sp.]|nr:hypothetical protein [Ruminiclostridium sp.]